MHPATNSEKNFRLNIEQLTELKGHPVDSDDEEAKQERKRERVGNLHYMIEEDGKYKSPAQVLFRVEERGLSLYVC